METFGNFRKLLISAPNPPQLLDAIGPVTNQAAGLSKVAPLIKRWNGMACRQRDEVGAMTGKEWVSARDESADLLLHQILEGSADFVFVAITEVRRRMPAAALSAG